MHFDRGYLSPVSSPTGRMECVYEDVFILDPRKKISAMKDLLPLLEQLARGGKPLLIAPRTSRARRSRLVVNKIRGIAPVRRP